MKPRTRTFRFPDYLERDVYKMAKYAAQWEARNGPLQGAIGVTVELPERWRIRRSFGRLYFIDETPRKYSELCDL